ncbi:hypothetical protein SEUCBS139899_008814 [Sporothrix eucalyptigena]|uniref:F-box domain-containing protein n=1 Tax=Sporothrix eucalyptigena TaxID=1812306 RepID=A0ABP0APX1_9PEZI
MNIPLSSSAGKKRALPLDLNDIARAILNLPADSSALLPSPAPFPQSFEVDVSAGGASSAFGCAVPESETDQAPTLPTSSRVHRVIRKAMRISTRHIKRDIERGNLTSKQMHDILHERRVMHDDWHSHKNENLIEAGSEINEKGKGKAIDEPSADYQKLDEAWLKRNTVHRGFVSCDNPDINSIGRPTQVFTQNLGGRGSSQMLTTCETGAIFPWTKYFKGPVITPVQLEDAENALAMLPAQPLLSPTSRKGRAPMGQGLQIVPAPKRRLISRSVSLGQQSTETQNTRGSVLYQTDTTVDSSPQPSVQQGTSTKFDLISSISSCPELIMHVCEYMRLADILVLYRVSRVFKSTFDSDLEKNVQRMARQFATAETRSIFSWYRVTKIISPLSYVGLEPQSPWTREFQGQFPQAPSSPGLRYVGMLASRERKVRDIVAVLARSGHRLPRTSATAALKKMWLLMDIPTNSGRVLVLKDEELFTDLDLLTIQMFHVKLVLHFHDPLWGPDVNGEEQGVWPVPPPPPQEFLSLNVSDFFGDSGYSKDDEMAAAAAARDYIMMHQRQLPEHSLVELLLGQRSGFNVLWNLLRGKAYRTLSEVVELKAKYDCKPSAVFSNSGGRHHDLKYNINPGWERYFRTNDGTQSSAEDSQSYSSSYEDNGPYETVASSSFLFDDIFSPPSEAPADPSHSLAVVSDPLVNVHGTNVPRSKIGQDHLEGWGKGSQHLLRPDELVSLEAARRVQENPDDHLDLSSHVPFMAVWGNRDFDTGTNVLPDVDEMYISDDEYDRVAAMGTNNKEEDKENSGAGVGAAHALPTNSSASNPKDEAAAITVLISEEFAEGLYPTAENHLQTQVGNVLLDRDDWQPWHVLRTRWDTLNLQEKLDLWWLSHQVRLHRQAWTPRDGNDRRVVQASQANMVSQGTQTDESFVNENSYTLPDFPTDDEGDDADDGRGTDADEDMDPADLDDMDYFAEDEDGEEDASPKPTAHGSSPPSTPPAETDFQTTGGSSSSYANIPLPDTAQKLPKRQQKLMQSCIQWALREQDEVDEALLAQADMEYEAEEMEHWEEFLTAAGPMLEGVDITSLDEEINNEGWMSEDHIGDTPIPNPEEVLMPEFGGMNDVIRLVQQIHGAEADLDAARFAISIDGPLHSATVAAAADRRLTELKETVEDLKVKLEIMIQAEVFAIEL